MTQPRGSQTQVYVCPNCVEVETETEDSHWIKVPGKYVAGFPVVVPTVLCSRHAPLALAGV